MTFDVHCHGRSEHWGDRYSISTTIDGKTYAYPIGFNPPGLTYDKLMIMKSELLKTHGLLD